MGTISNLLGPVLLDTANTDLGTRIFGLDAQLIFDAVVLAINIFLLLYCCHISCSIL